MVARKNLAHHLASLSPAQNHKVRETGIANVSSTSSSPSSSSFHVIYVLRTFLATHFKTRTSSIKRSHLQHQNCSPTFSSSAHLKILWKTDTSFLVDTLVEQLVSQSVSQRMFFPLSGVILLFAFCYSLLILRKQRKETVSSCRIHVGVCSYRKPAASPHPPSIAALHTSLDNLLFLCLSVRHPGVYRGMRTQGQDHSLTFVLLVNR